MRARGAAAVLALGAVLASAGCGGDDAPAPPPEANRSEPRTETGPVRAAGKPRLETVATGLDIPWDVAFLPDGRALITERTGGVRLLSAGGELQQQPVADVDVAAEGEGGLLGLAIDPQFERNRFVYLYRTTTSGNEVARYRLEGDRLREEAVVMRGAKAGLTHDGGRIHFGPDDRLYISVGDVREDRLAQDPGSLNGKMLRLEPGQYRRGGGRPEIFSSGHRNSQGFDWQPKTNRLYQSEHGPEGFDEINLLKRGGNHGWPEVFGKKHGRFRAPLAVYEQPSVAPSGATFVTQPGSAWTGDFLVAMLVGEQVRRLRFDGSRVTVNEPLFQRQVGRVRTVVEGPDGALYLLTSNRDGRGAPREGDDRLIRVIPPKG